MEQERDRLEEIVAEYIRRASMKQLRAIYVFLLHYIR